MDDQHELDADEITCPYCHHEHTEAEDREGHVTYWGEAGKKPYDCSECGLTFAVEEKVSRSFTMTALVQLKKEE